MTEEYQAGRLAVRVYENRSALGLAAARDAAAALKAAIQEKGVCNAVFAAAPSQNEFLEALCASDVDWTKVNAFHMDEYIGLPADAVQRFGNFLRERIFGRLPFRSVSYIRGESTPVEEEIARYTALLRENPTDIVFMGIGENGHIAFNDPHVAHFDDTRAMNAVTLDERCRLQQVHDGCFASLAEVPARALTLTVPALFAAKAVFCMVPGATKAEAVGKTVLGEIREQVPATILRMHPNAALYLDRDSGRDVLAAKRETAE